jgi:hypothetical protein
MKYRKSSQSDSSHLYLPRIFENLSRKHTYAGNHEVGWHVVVRAMGLVQRGTGKTKILDGSKVQFHSMLLTYIYIYSCMVSEHQSWKKLLCLTLRTARFRHTGVPPWKLLAAEPFVVGKGVTFKINSNHVISLSDHDRTNSEYIWRRL